MHAASQPSEGLALHIEAIVFAAGVPVTPEEIAQSLAKRLEVSDSKLQEGGEADQAVAQLINGEDPASIPAVNAEGQQGPGQEIDSETTDKEGEEEEAAEQTPDEPSFTAPDSERVSAILEELVDKYAGEQYPFHLVRSGGGYQFLTKAPYHQTIAVFQNIKSKRRLSTAAMETLSIIAYRQPVTKTDIEAIRGVNCDYSIQKLLEKELIAITGRLDGPGKPLLYGTSQIFMDYFGINSIEELPKLVEFEHEGQQIGTAADLVDQPLEPGVSPAPADLKSAESSSALTDQESGIEPHDAAAMDENPEVSEDDAGLKTDENGD